MLRLAGPVVLAELGWMGMGTVDVVMLGRVGRETLAGASTGEAIFHWPALIGVGMLLGMDALVAQAFGAGRRQDCEATLRQGVWLAALLTLPLMASVLLLSPSLAALGVAEETRDSALAYIHTINWGTLPLLLYTAFRRYLQGIGDVAPITLALVSANLVNLAGNWILIYGNLGAPALGVTGSAWATNIARVYMAGVLALHAWRTQRRTGEGPFRGSWAPDGQRLRELVRLGWPASAQIGLEIGVFSIATVLAGALSTVAVAAHQIALNTAALTFMVPLGISSAAAVRVGHGIGARDGAAARRAGWTALLLGAAFMLAAGASFFLAPDLILSAYTTDATVLAVGSTLLYVAAFFQLFDGVQVVATGALRGLGDTRTPMVANLIGHWFIGLPVSWYLGFHTGLGVFGIWIGLSAGLIGVAIALLTVWQRRSRRLVVAVYPPHYEIKQAG